MADLKAPVLVVDDHEGTVGILKGLLTRLGFETVEGCTSASSAWDRLEGTEYGLVISDWHMTPMSGHDLLVRLRAKESKRRTPFVVVTADASTDSVVTARRAGADNYMVKPFSAETLKAQLVTVIGDF
ncbi:response regulator [soil metagenome]